MSKYYKPINISKYSHSVPEEIKQLGDRELTEKELKELNLIPSGLSDIASATFGVGKAALNVTGEGGKDDKKDKEAEKEKKLDYKQYASFLEKGFKNYQDQYFVHPIIYSNEKKRRIGYTVLSMVTGSSITLQPYKLVDNDLYKLSVQVLPGKFRSIIQKIFSWFNYDRIDYKKMEVTNISNSKDPVRSFKMDQILKEPVYKELNKFNPNRGTKFTCSIIFYDDSKRKLIIGKDIGIEQVTQDKITLSKIHSKEVKKGGSVETKLYSKKHEIALSMLIPAYASEIVEDKMKENNKFYYDHIFPMTVSSLEEYEKLTGVNLTEGIWDTVKSKVGSMKPKKTELVLFYLKPLLIVSESEKEMESFRGDMDTFNFDTHKGYISSLSSLVYGEDSRGGGGGSPVKKVSLSKLRKFFVKHGTYIRLYGWTPKLRALLLRYAMRPSFNVYDFNSNILKEEENAPAINKDELITSIRKRELPILDLKYLGDESTQKEGEMYFKFKVLKISGDTQYTQGISENQEIRIPSSYFEHIEEIKDDSNKEIPSVFINEEFFTETSTGQRGDQEEEEDEEEEDDEGGSEQTAEQEESNNAQNEIPDPENASEREDGTKNVFIFSTTSGNKLTPENFNDYVTLRDGSYGGCFTLWYQGNNAYLKINSDEYDVINYWENRKSNYIKELQGMFDANYSDFSEDNLPVDIRNIEPAQLQYKSLNDNNYEFELIKKGKIELVSNQNQFSNNREESPSNSSATPDSISNAVSDTDSTSLADILNNLEQVTADMDNTSDNAEDLQKQKREMKLKNILEFISKEIPNKSLVDIIEVNSNDINDTQSFANHILDFDTIEDMSDIVIKKYEGNINNFNPTDNKNYFVIENIKEIQLSSNTNNNSSNNQQTQDSNTPDIDKAEGEVKYYKNLDEDLNNAEETNSSDKRAFFQIWEQGNNYYAKVNTNSAIRSLITVWDSSLVFFDYKKNPTATSIENIKPAVFDAETKKLTKKGQIELT